MFSSFIKNLITLAEKLADYEKVSLWRIGHKAANRGSFFVDLKTGRSCQINTAERVLNWFSQNWPPEIEWPADIPRPPKDHK